MRRHVIWNSIYRICMKERKKTKKTWAERARLYIIDDSKMNRSIVIIEKEIDATQRAISKNWTLVETKKKKNEEKKNLVD